jgi:hypothetical protein
MDDRDSIPGLINDEILVLHHSVQTGSGAHPASYPMGTVVKRPGRESDHVPSFSV